MSQYRVVGGGHLALELRKGPALQEPALMALTPGSIVDAEDGVFTVFGSNWRHVVRPMDGWAPAEFLASPVEPVIAPPPPPPPGVRTHVVGPNDTLSSLAAHFYGDAAQWPRIFAANRDKIANPNVIRDGQTLVIPDAGAAPLPPVVANVQPGVVVGPFNAQSLYALVRRHGAPPLLDKIMVTAALVESGGDPGAIGDQGHAAGLWQMHDAGLGAGMTVAARCDPDIACATMLVEFRKVFIRHVSAGLQGIELAVRTYLDTERPFQFNLPGNAAELKFRAAWPTVPDL